MHYPYAKTIQNFYRRHRKAKYNYKLESSLEGLDSHLEVVMRAVLGRLDVMEGKIAEIHDEALKEKKDGDVAKAWGGGN